MRVCSYIGAYIHWLRNKVSAIKFCFCVFVAGRCCCFVMLGLTELVKRWSMFQVFGSYFAFSWRDIPIFYKKFCTKQGKRKSRSNCFFFLSKKLVLYPNLSKKFTVQNTFIGFPCNPKPPPLFLKMENTTLFELYI